MTAARLPRALRRQAHQLGLAKERRAVPPRRCWCNRPVPASSTCGCCCAHHETDVDAVAAALIAAMDRHPSGKAPKTDGGISLREYLALKGER